ncbi:DUF1643 domain-containing protein [Lysinibacillus sp. NPDC048646]|uniref:DUF1643 domain-containing protein n=1 Tax=Lysinibacillus sp. NPDC048646 TaxID=3390574 RepID=UPI003CFD2248
MIGGGQTDEIVQDQTTMYVINNLAKLDYGSVIIMNLFTSLEDKMHSLDSEEDKRKLKSHAC